MKILTNPSRLGILGGMFDPVHRGHVAAALHAADLLQLDRVKLIPCNQPNHRPQANATATRRLAMLELAIAAEPRLEADACEITRGGVSYSATTLRQFRESGITSSIVFIMGMDALNGINQWHDWQSIFANAHLLVLARDGATLNPETAAAIDFKRRVCQQPEQMFEAEAGKIYISDGFAVTASSTMVRKALQADNQVSEVLDASVLNYIRQHQLYPQPYI